MSEKCEKLSLQLTRSLDKIDNDVRTHSPHVSRRQSASSGGPLRFCFPGLRGHGHQLIIIDSPVAHTFDFTPSMSLFVDFDQTADLDRTFNRLAEGGDVKMPLGDYGFSPRFGWLTDLFGVSWQLNLSKA
jgi:predicted 3-demethylubiquinone-9 3-methyltransferase (glyoxalase superfamily)